jgi:hypothetical protein
MVSAVSFPLEFGRGAAAKEAAANISASSRWSGPASSLRIVVGEEVALAARPMLIVGRAVAAGRAQQ